MLRDLKINVKLNLLFVSIFLVTIIVSGVVLSAVLYRDANKSVTDQAYLLMETMSSVRHYTGTQVEPELSSRLDDNEFLPQTVPAYSAREVFEQLRTNPKYREFFYKEATLNPTNLRDKADDFETTIVESFKQQPDLKEQMGFRSFANNNLFYIARPISVSEQSCLRCHSTPSLAPKSQLATYGDENGFGWRLNEIIGAQVISVPTNQIFEKARSLQVTVIGVIILLFLLAMVLLNIFLQSTIKNPLKKIVNAANRLATGDMSAEFPENRKDEFGILGASLNRMKISLQIAMDMLDSESTD